jgi:hypothetical protein
MEVIAKLTPRSVLGDSSGDFEFCTNPHTFESRGFVQNHKRSIEAPKMNWWRFAIASKGKQFLSALLIGCMGLGATLNGSVLSDIRRESPSLACNEDVLFFSDHTQMCGKVEKFPTLKYTFGNIVLNPAELAAASFTPEGDRLMVKCITLNGEVFTGETREPLVMRDKDSEPKEIDPRTVSYLFLGNKGHETSRKTVEGKSHLVRLKNGDRLPVLFNSNSIDLSDGYSNSSIRPDAIVDVDYNGGLQGTVKQGDETTSIPYSFVKNQHLNVFVPYMDSALLLPWNNIDSITAIAQLSPEEKRVLPQNLTLREPEKAESTPDTQNNITLQDLLKSLSRQQEMQTASIATEGFLLQDPVEMVYIPEGVYLLSLQPEGQESPSLTIVKVPAFYIDSHPVSNREYKQFVDATAYAQPNHWVNGQIPAGKEDQPVTNVSYKDAESYAQWTGKRLPTEIEWEAAAKRAASGSISLENLDSGLMEWAILTPNAPGNSSAHKIVRQKMILDRENNSAQLQRSPLKFDDSNGETAFRLVVDFK